MPGRRPRRECPLGRGPRLADAPRGHPLSPRYLGTAQDPAGHGQRRSGRTARYALITKWQRLPPRLMASRTSTWTGRPRLAPSRSVM